MRRLFILLFFSVLLSASFDSCRTTPNDGIPFFVKIDSVQLFTKNDNSQGLNTQNVSDVWVEAGKFNIGAFELPAKFPVLQKGNVNFVISAGIKESGSSYTRVIYPMYDADTFSLFADLDTVYTHTPTFRYKQGVDFVVLQNFDFGHDFNNLTLTDDTNHIYGNSCGVIAPSDSNLEASHQDPFMANPGDNVWLEVDYKAEIPFYVGVYAIYSGIGVKPTRLPMVFVNSRSTWNKIYINLTNAVAELQGDGYSIYFEALKPFGHTGSSKVYIDNVKVLVLP